MRQPEARMADVASQAGVSLQTVSNTLNRPEIVQAETLERVRQAISQLDYRPMSAARHLRSGRARAIAFVMPIKPRSLSGIYERFLQALTYSAQQCDRRIVLLVAGSDEEEIEQYDHLLMGNIVDSFILADTHPSDRRVERLMEREVHFASFGRPWGVTSPVPYPWVDIDGAAGTGAATTRHIMQGHRRIGFIGWPDDHSGGDDRRRGWAGALETADLDSGGLWRAVPDTPVDGRDAAEELIRDGATALVFASDTQALGAVSEAGAAGVAVTGFDDTPTAHAVELSSLAQPLNQVADLLIDALIKPASENPHQVLLPPTLVERASSIAAPAAASESS